MRVQHTSGHVTNCLGTFKTCSLPEDALGHKQARPGGAGNPKSCSVTRRAESGPPSQLEQVQGLARSEEAGGCRVLTHHLWRTATAAGPSANRSALLKSRAVESTGSGRVSGTPRQHSSRNTTPGSTPKACQLCSTASHLPNPGARKALKGKALLTTTQQQHHAADTLLKRSLASGAGAIPDLVLPVLPLWQDRCAAAQRRRL